ncbi:hypothetical protein [Aristophania vespae]|uniref:hypothetical protein n=1 Tax=Aristophania vespae TaxID=2697033 RepID=UPI002351A464|nr:hypothetical protein [Aristophania vespae]UMM63159.1 hypothetical protein DM15PD_01140 [Aristophania vespae]
MSSVTAINERLNLVIPLDDNKGFVHCPPFSREAFAQCWRLLARTWSALETGNMSITASGAVAGFELRDQAQAIGEEGQEQHKALMAEIRRKSIYIGATENGFDPIPLASAIKKGLLEDEDIADIENALVFFIAASALLPKNRRNFVLELMKSLRAVESTSLDSTAYLVSLQKSKKKGITGEMAAA